MRLQRHQGVNTTYYNSCLVFSDLAGTEAPLRGLASSDVGVCRLVFMKSVEILVMVVLVAWPYVWSCL